MALIFQVDIIVSEWMGYFLLFESMLDTVLWARDRYLSPDGVLLPDRCSVSLVAIADPDLYRRNLGFWDDVYGFKMSCMKTEVAKEPSLNILREKSVVSQPCVVKVSSLIKSTVEPGNYRHPGNSEKLS